MQLMLVPAVIFLIRLRSAIISVRTSIAVVRLSLLKRSNVLSCHQVKSCQRHRTRQRQANSKFIGCDQQESPAKRGFLYRCGQCVDIERNNSIYFIRLKQKNKPA
nr:MAG TPA: hypothetical protein [Caudoviricetes sp.]